MARASKPKVVIQNPNLLRAIKGFVPSFANTNDQWILKKISKHNKLLREVDNVVLRSGKNLTKKMQELLKDEDRLIELIDERNMDF